MGRVTWGAAAGLLLASCAVVAPVQSTQLPAPTGAVADDPAAGDHGSASRVTLGRLVDPRELTVTFTTFSPESAGVAAQLAPALPAAWDTATGGRSRIRVIDGDADIHVLVLQTAGDSTGGGRGITLRFPGTAVGARQVGVLIHELGHALGCCYDAGSDGRGHWSACVPQQEIMCSGGPRGSVTFSERELRTIRLLD